MMNCAICETRVRLDSLEAATERMRAFPCVCGTPRELSLIGQTCACGEAVRHGYLVCPRSEGFAHELRDAATLLTGYAPEEHLPPEPIFTAPLAD